MNKWHDLRKNPKDLPKEDGKYLCESKSALCPEASFMEVCNFSNDLYAVDEFDFCKYKKTKKECKKMIHIVCGLIGAGKSTFVKSKLAKYTD